MINFLPLPQIKLTFFSPFIIVTNSSSGKIFKEAVDIFHVTIYLKRFMKEAKKTNKPKIET